MGTHIGHQQQPRTVLVILQRAQLYAKRVYVDINNLAYGLERDHGRVVADVVFSYVATSTKLVHSPQEAQVVRPSAAWHCGLLNRIEARAEGPAVPARVLHGLQSWPPEI